MDKSTSPPSPPPEALEEGNGMRVDRTAIFPRSPVSSSDDDISSSDVSDSSSDDDEQRAQWLEADALDARLQDVSDNQNNESADIEVEDVTGRSDSLQAGDASDRNGKLTYELHSVSEPEDDARRKMNDHHDHWPNMFQDLHLAPDSDDFSEEDIHEMEQWSRRQRELRRRRRAAMLWRGTGKRTYSELDDSEDLGQSEPKKVAPDSLATMLRDALVKSQWPYPGERESQDVLFVPLDALDSIITKDSVRAEIESWNLFNELELERTVEDILKPHALKDSTSTTAVLSRRKLFAILIMIDTPQAILELIDNDIHDQDLPFLLDEKDAHSLERQGDARKLSIFSSWNSKDRDQFSFVQWYFLAPSFKVNENPREITNYLLSKNTPLPFITCQGLHGHTYIGAEAGRYIHKLAIHTAHYAGPASHGRQDTAVAVKVLSVQDAIISATKTEASPNMRLLAGDLSPHVARLLFTFSHGHGNKRCLVFPSQKGDLYDFWKKCVHVTFKHPNLEAVRWMASQFYGLANVLEQAWCLPDSSPSTFSPPASTLEVHPKTILWFDGDERGPRSENAYIDIFGILKFDISSLAAPTHDDDMIEFYSQTYAAPERCMGKPAKDSQMWSFGCVLLEFLVWYHRGREQGVLEFMERRKRGAGAYFVNRDAFFSYQSAMEYFDDWTWLNPSVRRMISTLRVDSKGIGFMEDILDLVENGLLQMSPGKRLTAEALSSRLKKIHDTCMASETYCIGAGDAGDVLDDDTTDLESLFSTFSQSSIESFTTLNREQMSGTALVVELLLFDEELNSLYQLASSQVSLTKLRTHLYGFLRIFGKELQSEAKDERTRLASTFIRRSARHIANGIGSSLMPDDQDEVLPSLREDNFQDDKEQIINTYLSSLEDATNQQHDSTTEPFRHDQQMEGYRDVSDEDSDDGNENDDNLNANLELDEVKRFLILSEALSKMKRELRKWLKVEEDESDFASESGSQAFPFMGEDSIAVEEPENDYLDAACLKEYDKTLLQDDSISAAKSSQLPEMSPLARLLEFITWMLIWTGLQEQPVLPGHRRIQWRNKRGHMLYDDYIEHEPGALDELSDYLNTFCQHDPGSDQSRQSAAANLQSSGSAGARAAPSAKGPSNEDSPSLIRDPSNNTTSADIELANFPKNPLYLCLCADRKRYKVHLDQKSIIDITHDKELFLTLRRHYYTERKGLWRSYLSMRTIESINFTKFFYHGPLHNDPQQHSEHCSTSCECLPPPSYVPNEYKCNPIPPKYSPPVGPKLLMDYFTDPHAINPNRTWILEQLPKRALAKFDPEPLEPIEAWGLYFKEGWNWNKIWWILGLGFFPPSLLFGILWAVLKQDIQGAFGVASWYMTAAAIVLGIVGSNAWTV